MSTTLQSLRRTPYQSLSIFFALTFSFLILLIFSSTILVLTRIINYIETQPQVTAYFLKTTPESDIFRLREKLLSNKNVKEVKYISKEEALKIYKNLNKNEPLLLEMVSSEALPASLEIFTTKPEYLKPIALEVSRELGVEDVAFQQDVIDNLIKITNGIKVAALVFLTAQFIIVFFVIFSTITFKIMAKKEEIEILRLLGGSRSFIMQPLFAETLLINTAAALTSSGLLVGSYLLLSSKFNTFLTGVPPLPLYETVSFSITIWPPNIYFFATLTGLSFIIGYLLIWLTTFFAASKYIK